mmetsp:Transcript_8884/g.22511  ORF Transcript_8884/g.22511 Transcript_8884/m.22511 type:complete len:222 (-) Transcript_8884:13-678(-)
MVLRCRRRQQRLCAQSQGHSSRTQAGGGLAVVMRAHWGYFMSAMEASRAQGGGTVFSAGHDAPEWAPPVAPRSNHRACSHAVSRPAPTPAHVLAPRSAPGHRCPAAATRRDASPAAGADTRTAPARLGGSDVAAAARSCPAPRCARRDGCAEARQCLLASSSKLAPQRPATQQLRACRAWLGASSRASVLAVGHAVVGCQRVVALFSTSSQHSLCRVVTTG